MKTLKITTDNKISIIDLDFDHNGYVYTKEEFGRFLNKLSDLIEVGINVVLTAHAQLRKFEQPDELGAYDRWELKLGKKTQSQTSPLVKEWADMLLFANYKTFSVAVGKDGKKHKGQGGKRTMYTQHHPCWDAKNRFGLPEECEFDYSVIAEIIEGTKKSVPVPKEEKSIEIQKPPVKDNDFMNIPKDTDEKVDFDTGAKVEEPVKSTGKKVEDSVFHIADYIPKALRDLMYPNLVSEEELGVLSVVDNVQGEIDRIQQEENQKAEYMVLGRNENSILEMITIIKEYAERNGEEPVDVFNKILGEGVNGNEE